jgi:hypothetical protein
MFHPSSKGDLGEQQATFYQGDKTKSPGHMKRAERVKKWIGSRRLTVEEAARMGRNDNQSQHS